MTPRLAVFLGTEAAEVDRADHRRQGGERGRRRIRPVAEMAPEAAAAGQFGVEVAADDAVRDPLEHLEGPRRRLVDPLAPQDEHVRVAFAWNAELVEQAGLAGTGLGLHQDEAAGRAGRAVQHLDQLRQLLGPPDERRLRQHVTEVALTRRDGWFDEPGLEGDADLLDVEQCGGRRLVPRAGILGQEALQDAFERHAARRCRVTAAGEAPCSGDGAGPRPPCRRRREAPR